MLIFSTHNRVFQFSGLALFLLQISLFAFALKPFHYGTWYQVEPMVLALFVLAMANSAWLAVGLWRGWLAFIRPFHPLLLCLLAWVGWQWFASAFATSTWRSWFGAASIGEGTGFYTAVVLSFLLASALWQRLAYQKIILALASFNVALMAGLHIDFDSMCKPAKEILPRLEVTAAGNWPDYLVFLVAYLWIAFMGSPRLRTPARYVLLVTMCAFIITFVAENETAKLLLRPGIIAGGVLLWIHLFFRPRWLTPGKIWRGLGVLGCLFFAVWIIKSQQPKWLHCTDESMPTRALFNQVALSTVEHEPRRLLMGDGWGSYPNDLFNYILIDGLHAFEDGRPEHNWWIIHGTAYHTHNAPLEVVLSLGLPGLLLWLSLPMAAIATIARRKFWWCIPMLLGITTLQSFWFFLPQVMAYQALSWAVLASGWRRHVQSEQEPLKSRWPAFACGVLVAVMAWSASAQLEAIRYGERLSNAMKHESDAGYSVEWLLQDVKRGGERLREAGWFYGGWIGERVAAQEVTARDLGWYNKLMQAAHQAATLSQAGAWLLSLDVWMHNRVFMIVDDGALAPIKPKTKQTMEETVVRFSQAVPLREDFTAPFFYSLEGFTDGDKARAQQILQRVLEVAPNHRPALWLRGQQLRATPGREAEGLKMQMRAIELGLERVYPVTRQEINAVRDETK